MGAVYTRTTHREVLRPGGYDGRPLLERYFHPYAAAMTDAVTQRLDAAGRAVIIDVHSYPTERLPYELHGDGPRPPICLGRDAFHTPADLLTRAAKAFAGFGGTGVNSPFEGTYVPLKYYGNEPRVSALMIEIRRDVYMSEPGGPAGPGLDALAGALAELVDMASGARRGPLSRSHIQRGRGTLESATRAARARRCGDAHASVHGNRCTGTGRGDHGCATGSCHHCARFVGAPSVRSGAVGMTGRAAP